MTSRSRIGALALAALLLGAVAAPAPRARADEAATERRLKRIGVPKPLREEVRVAIDRGVDWLASKQGENGLWFAPDSHRYWQSRIPFGDVYNALATLALVHADTPTARAAASRALAHLLPADGPPAPWLVRTVPGAAYAEMILDATGGDPKLIGALAARIARARDPKSGAFAHLTAELPAAGLSTPPRVPPLAGPISLFSSQLGVLGLHVAELHGARGTRDAWEDVLEGLLRGQQPDGSWRISFHRPDAISSPSAAATPVGLASLALAARHLDVANDTGRGTSRRRRVEAALAASRDALRADGTLILWAARRGDWSTRRTPGLAGWWGADCDAWSLWALERACVTLGIESIDGTPWYAHAARTLVDSQQADGSWPFPPGGDAAALMETSFALLVLLRDAERPAEDTPADEAAAAVTPSDGAAAAPPKKKPAGAGVPADEAATALTRLRDLLRRGTAPNREILGLVDLLARARTELAPPKDASAPAVDPTELLNDIRDAFVDALFLAGEDPDGDEEGRRPVNRVAAALLASAPADVLAEVRARLVRSFADGKATDGPFETTPYRPVFRLLARRGDAATFAWMLDVALHDDLTGERAERALAFLLAVPEFDDLPGRVRRDAADTIANAYAGRSAASEAAYYLDPKAQPTDRMRWSLFRPRVMEALYHLAADPTTGAEPENERGTLPATVGDFADWLRDHRNPHAAPWR